MKDGEGGVDPAQIITFCTPDPENVFVVTKKAEDEEKELEQN